MATAALALLIQAGCSRSTSGDREVAAQTASLDQAATAPEAHAQAATRFEWEPTVEPRDWTAIVIHHSATETGSVELIDRSHRQRRDASGQPWQGIGYHFVIGNGQGMPDGQTEPTFRWRGQLHGAHAGDAEFNDSGVGICLFGHFDHSPPTQRQLDAARRLVAALRSRFSLTDDAVIAHRDVKATACPGRFLKIQDLLEPAADVPSAEIAQHKVPSPRKLP